METRHNSILATERQTRRIIYNRDPWEGITFNLYQQRARETVGSVSDDHSCVRNDNGGGDDVACTGGADLCDHQTPIIVC